MVYFCVKTLQRSLFGILNHVPGTCPSFPTPVFENATSGLFQALETYAKKRTHDQKGVTIPSQIRLQLLMVVVGWLVGRLGDRFMMFMMFVKKKSQKHIINTKVRVFTTDIQYKVYGFLMIFRCNILAINAGTLLCFLLNLSAFVAFNGET